MGRRWAPIVPRVSRCAPIRSAAYGHHFPAVSIIMCRWCHRAMAFSNSVAGEDDDAGERAE